MDTFAKEVVTHLREIDSRVAARAIQALDASLYDAVLSIGE